MLTFPSHVCFTDMFTFTQSYFPTMLTFLQVYLSVMYVFPCLPFCHVCFSLFTFLPCMLLPCLPFCHVCFFPYLPFCHAYYLSCFYTWYQDTVEIKIKQFLQNNRIFLEEIIITIASSSLPETFANEINVLINFRISQHKHVDKTVHKLCWNKTMWADEVIGWSGRGVVRDISSDH